MKDPTRRFSSRVEDYVHYRPHYPPEIIAVLREECGLGETSVVADIGSGTGFLSELFLGNGNQVYAVEPNADMRAAGERLYGARRNFRSVNATAESTTLAVGSIDFVTCGQAFHWFDRGKARLEFSRILVPRGWVVLVWNERRTDATPFLREYEDLILKYSADYHLVHHGRISGEVLREFFGPDGYRMRTFPNLQMLSLNGVKGRLLSSSYMPEADDPSWGSLLWELEAIVHRHGVDGLVRFEYDTRMYYGQMPDFRAVAFMADFS